MAVQNNTIKGKMFCYFFFFKNCGYIVNKKICYLSHFLKYTTNGISTFIMWFPYYHPQTEILYPLSSNSSLSPPIVPSTVLLLSRVLNLFKLFRELKAETLGKEECSFDNHNHIWKILNQTKFFNFMVSKKKYTVGMMWNLGFWKLGLCAFIWEKICTLSLLIVNYDK